MPTMSSPAAAHTPAPKVIPEWTLGDRLRKARRLAQLGQAEFAERLGQNQKTYAAWELDTSHPRNLVAVAKRIEALSGVPAAWLLGIDAVTTSPDTTIGWYSRDIPLRIVGNSQVRRGERSKTGVASMAARTTWTGYRPRSDAA